MIEKKLARQIIKEKILKLENKSEREQDIISALKLELKEGMKILAYRADVYEVNLDSFLFSEEGKKFSLYYPRVLSIENREMEFVYPDSWEIGAYGILSPVGKRIIDKKELDLVLLPSLSFNLRAYRLGRGAGFYDRAFRGFERKKILGFSFSKDFLIDFKEDSCDIQVNKLITPEDSLIFSDR
ncbi:MAG: 5-formyltetrahydrofolate cyclo-ligase [Leptospiraceae bacterium]|nr:5-formyltetrahydrofolate cyclo-ligase [Leptospiraceae bacterium]MCP5498436.1 5-formyltetrahydrofolate cyclo-ligase [Leptospiraceae bacterium]